MAAHKLQNWEVHLSVKFFIPYS